jgi:hypothetical protein
MARAAASTVQDIVRTGVIPSYASAAATADGNQFQNDGRVFLHVKNSGTEKTVTVQTPGLVDGLAIAELAVVVVATTGDKIIGPFPPGIYNQADGNVYWNVSLETGVTFAVLRL